MYLLRLLNSVYFTRIATPLSLRSSGYPKGFHSSTDKKFDGSATRCACVTLFLRKDERKLQAIQVSLDSLSFNC